MEKHEPLVLGIETSCDETAAAVLRGDRQVLANVVASQHELHAKFGGVVPEIASRAHIERILPVIEQSLTQAEAGLDQLDAIAVGNRPGLIGSLLVGVSAAKSLAWAAGKPLVGVDHVQAHLIAAALDAEPIAYPAAGLVVSGGHTSLYRLDSPLELHVLGRTIDDAVGEAFDKVAAILQLGFPGGPAVDRLARQGDPEAVKLPRTLLAKDSLDFSLSGLKTAVLYHVRGMPTGRGRHASFERDASMMSEQQKADVAAAFQAAVIDVIIEKLRRLVVRLRGEGSEPRSLVIGGGVSANSALRQRTETFAAEQGLALRLPPLVYCLDNAAMIAALAVHELRAGRHADLTLEAVATTAS